MKTIVLIAAAVISSIATAADSPDPHKLMASTDESVTLVMATNSSGSVATFACPAGDVARLRRGSALTSSVRARTTYPYGEGLGAGPLTNLTGWTALSFDRRANVKLVHFQVYEKYGFDPTTAVLKAGIHTAPFTELDHEALPRLFEAYGMQSGTLDFTREDSDGDGLPDGWELYVMFGPHEPGGNALCPWLPDGTQDFDRDGLDAIREFDEGHIPTDPWSIDTDGDGVIDTYEYVYRLKGLDALEDSDGDGLTNYTEYLISEVFGFARIDVSNPRSNGIPDYFTKFGNIYLGELFCDTSTDSADDDGDGWSRQAEVSAGKDPQDGASYPVPEISVELFMNGHISDTVVLMAWSETSDRYMLGKPDAIWTVKSGERPFGIEDRNMIVVTNADAVASKAHKGHVREGMNTFVCFADKDGNGYTAGDPMCVVQGVNVGWREAELTVALSDHSPITPRFLPWQEAQPTDDRMSDLEKTVKRLANWSTNINISATNALNQVVEKVASTGKCRLRVVRFGVNDLFAHMAGISTEIRQRVVLEREYDSNARNFLHEGDFLQDGEFDIDWNNFDTEVDSDHNVHTTVGSAITNMTYLVVLDGGEGNETWLHLGDDKTIINALHTVIERRFETVRSNPQGLAPLGSVEHGARQTFVWSMPNEEAWAKAYGSSYTAFRLQVQSEAGELVYDSDVRRAPIMKNGRFEWTAPLYLPKVGNWKWRVTMYNSKYKPIPLERWWSAWASFSTAINAQQDMNDHNYSSIDVAVKYSGPEVVLDKLADEDAEGKLYVQAFASADFSGDPLAQTVLTDKVSVTNAVDPLANCTLIGLDNKSTYFVRAFIDSNGNGVLDPFETWGRAPSGINIDQMRPPRVEIFMSDFDSDRDGIPDSFEYASYGSLTNLQGRVRENATVIIDKSNHDRLVSGVAGISSRLNLFMLPFISDQINLIGYEGQTATTTVSQIKSQISGSIEENKSDIIGAIDISIP